MKYRGYIAAVEFDDSVCRLHGRVINSGPYPIVTFEATDDEGIRREFKRSVDEYLVSCEEDGVEPRTALGCRRPATLTPSGSRFPRQAKRAGG